VFHSAESIFFVDNRQFSILLYCHGLSKITYGRFCYTVALTAAIRAETLVFQLRAVLHIVEFYLQHFQKNVHDPALCSTEWSGLRAMLQSAKSRLRAM
jgi:hypothetical protein